MKPFALFALVLVLSLPCGALAQTPEVQPPAAPVVAEVADVGVAVAAVPEAPAPVPAVVAPAAPVEPAAAAPVPAPVPAPPSVWEGLGAQVLSFVLPAAASVLTALGGLIMLLLRKRLGLDIDRARDAQIRSAVRSAIAGAEEWAARTGKAGVVVRGEAKLEQVVDSVRDQYPEMVPDDLRRMVDEELGSCAGLGATGDRCVVV